MDTAVGNSPFLDADAFLRADQSEFGNAWRYVGITVPLAALYERVVPEAE